LNRIVYLNGAWLVEGAAEALITSAAGLDRLASAI
jgi:hypothetical protein